ncbi:MAG: FxsA family protein [Brachybacterium sp.]|nr:FxsA family protein [Brachybacterium sp.]
MSTQHAPHSDPRATRDRSDQGEGRFARLELGLLILFGYYTSIWWVLLVVLIGWIIGVALVVAAGQQSFIRLRSLVRAVRGDGDIKDHMSRPAFTLLAAMLFFFPGFLTAVMGLVLLLTPVQKKAVRSMGFDPSGASTRQVFGRRSRRGVIEGEVVIDATGHRAGGTGTPGGPSGSAAAGDAPVITEDGTPPPRP